MLNTPPAIEVNERSHKQATLLHPPETYPTKNGKYPEQGVYLMFSDVLLDDHERSRFVQYSLGAF